MTNFARTLLCGLLVTSYFVGSQPMQHTRFSNRAKRGAGMPKTRPETPHKREANRGEREAEEILHKRGAEEILHAKEEKSDKGLLGRRWGKREAEEILHEKEEILHEKEEILHKRDVEDILHEKEEILHANEEILHKRGVEEILHEKEEILHAKEEKSDKGLLGRRWGKREAEEQYVFQRHR